MTTDEDYFATHIIEGEVRFRNDALELAGVNPDNLRARFIHPIPLGFKRMEPWLRFDESQLVCNYRLVDVETPTSQPGVSAYGASRVEVFHQREMLSPPASAGIEALRG